MKNKQSMIVFLSLIVFSFILLQCSENRKSDKVENIDPVKTFKDYITKHLSSYKQDKRENITLLGGGWVRLYYEPESNYKIDVQKTNSLVTPYTGYCEFTLTRHFTTFYKNKEDAAKDSIFIKSDKTIHRHHYGFQENNWVVTSREHMMISSVMDNDWYDCNEVLQEGIEKGKSNIFGCWEK